MFLLLVELELVLSTPFKDTFVKDDVTGPGDAIKKQIVNLEEGRTEKNIEYVGI